MKRALFICTQNRLRSPTAEQVFASWPDVESDSAGLGNDADIPLSSEQIAWATIIFVMEKVHRKTVVEAVPGALERQARDLPRYSGRLRLHAARAGNAAGGKGGKIFTMTDLIGEAM